MIKVTVVREQFRTMLQRERRNPDIVDWNGRPLLEKLHLKLRVKVGRLLVANQHGYSVAIQKSRE